MPRTALYFRDLLTGDKFISVERPAQERNRARASERGTDVCTLSRLSPYTGGDKPRISAGVEWPKRRGLTRAEGALRSRSGDVRPPCRGSSARAEQGCRVRDMDHRGVRTCRCRQQQDDSEQHGPHSDPVRMRPRAAVRPAPRAARSARALLRGLPRAIAIDDLPTNNHGTTAALIRHLTSSLLCLRG